MSKRNFFLKYIELNENKKIACQNLLDTAKAVLKGECVALKAGFFFKEGNLTNQ